MIQKTYNVFRFYPNGRVVLCAQFSTSEKAVAVARQWHSENPSAYYQVYESERRYQ